ncbi:Uncharacterized protein Adt_29931 [Abeliophyllum distichum]|uniref:Uncharacterized protein n=1 Tax=Abeliophyllum distichum TaxID=126358 RepID=A0ABD1R9S5_9LAMI
MKTSDTGSRKLLKSEFSDSESQENDSSDEEYENVTPRKEEKASEYELQRLKRIDENKKRMEALGLHKMANTFMGSFQKAQKKKIEKMGKRKMVDEDEEYKPSEMEEEICSSSEEGESDEEKFSGSQKRKAKKKTSTPKKQILNSGILDDDATLMQLIVSNALSLALCAGVALSLKDSAGFLDVPTSAPSQSPGAHAVDVIGNQKEGNPSIQEDVGKRKGKKWVSRSLAECK